MRPVLLLAVTALLAPAVAAESVLEDFASTEGLRLAGQRLQPESSLAFAAGPAGGREAVLHFRFVHLAEGIPTAGIQFPDGRTVWRTARRLLVAVRGDRVGLPLRCTFRDRSGELHMYQLEPTTGQGPGGSTVYATAIDRPGFFTWGGDGNKRPDPPLRLDQLFVDGNGTAGAEGTLFIGAIAVDADQDNRPPRAGKPEVVADYAGTGTAVLGGDRLDPASRLVIGAAGPFPRAAQLHVRFDGATKAPSCGVRFAPAVPLAGPLRRLLIPVRGEVGRLAIRADLFDARGELHMFTCTPCADPAAPDGFRMLQVDFASPPLFTAGGDGDRVLQWPARLDLIFVDGNGGGAAEGDLEIGPVSAEPEAGAGGPPRPVRPILLERCERLLAEAGTWGDHAQPAATLALDREERSEGEASLRLDYRFAPVDTGQAAFIPVEQRLGEGATRIRAAVRSAGQPRPVHATLIDAAGTFRTIPLGVAPADRWQELTADLAGAGLAWPVRWRDVVVSREAGRPDQGRLWLDAVGADLPDEPAERLAARLDLGRWPPLCWGEGDAPRGDLVVEGGAAESASLPLSCRLYDHRGRALGPEWRGIAAARAGTPFRHELDLHLPGYGVYELEVVLGGRSSRHSFSWLPARSRQWPEGPFGVNATPLWLLDAMAGIGMAWNRAEYGWRLVEHVPGAFADAAFAERQRAIAAAGMRTLMLVGDWGPQQCRRTGKAPDSAEMIEAYAGFAAWMATANPGPATRHFQIWNEPNLAGFWWPRPSVADYAHTLIAAHRAIKAADPAAEVVGINMSCVDLPFLDAVLERGGGAAMDILALHPYHLPEAPERAKRAVPSPTLGGEFPPGTFPEQMARLEEVLRRRGADHLRIWLDEYGYPDRPDLYPDFAHEEWRAAALVVRQSILALALPRVERLFAYNARDTATGDPGNWDNATGFVRSDGSPKARFAAWATMSRILEQRRFARSLAVGEGAFACEFAGPDGPALALWCVDGARTLAFAGAGATPLLTDGMGNARPLLPRDGRIVIGISEEPVWVTGWRDAAPAPVAFAPAGALRCAPGETAEIAAPAALPAEGWSLEAPAGWAVRRVAPGRFALAPEATARAGAVPLLLLGPGATLGATLVYGDSLRLRVRPGRAGAEVVVDNPYAAARRLAITVSPEGGAPGTVAAEAPPRAVAVVPIAVPTASADGVRTLPITVAAAPAAGEAAVPLVVEAGRRTVAGATPCPALVGGVPAGPVCRLDRPWQQVRLKPGTPFSAADQSGSFRAGWDAQRLHLEVDVRDDQHRPAADRTRLWQGDSLQFALAVAGVRHEFDVAIPATGEILTWRRAPAEGPADGLVAAGSRRGEITTYRVDLPWRLVGVDDPRRSGLDLRFALLVNDDDGAGRTGWLEWFEGIGLAKDAERYGPLLIE